jgi:rare lipoprotein A (peptidoglycan hydrolase)
MGFEDRPGGGISRLNMAARPPMRPEYRSASKLEKTPTLSSLSFRSQERASRPPRLQRLEAPKILSFAVTLADRPGLLAGRPIPRQEAVRPMRFEDRPGLSESRPDSKSKALTISSLSVRNEERLNRPPRVDRFPVAKSTGLGMRFEAPQGALSSRRMKLAAANPAIRFEDRPGLLANLRVIDAAAVRSMKFEDRPGLASERPRRVSLMDSLPLLGFAEFCAANPQRCDPFAFARRRAVMTPTGWDDHRLITYADTAINFSTLATPYLRQQPRSWHLSANPDACRIMSHPKQRYLDCLGLPARVLKNKAEIASPIYQRVGLIPRGGGQHKLGKAYRISGMLFRPHKDPTYNRVGVASWYGAQFHRRMTANGEWFDMEYYSAAHATMPLPSYARVTNLENGREMIVRVNDRGPFIKGRIIDLSKKSAELLDFKRRGTAKVRVQYVGPAPLDDSGPHLAAMNRELERGTPLDQMIAAASGLRHQAALDAFSANLFTE